MKPFRLLFMQIWNLKLTVFNRKFHVCRPLHDGQNTPLRSLYSVFCKKEDLSSAC